MRTRLDVSSRLINLFQELISGERAHIMAQEKASEFLSTIGCSMSDFITRCWFICGKASSGPRGKRISMLAFEVADTVAKGVRLFHSLSEENIKFLKRNLHSKGVQELVSTDMEELLSITAADQREKLDDFLQGVIRFGNLCKDPKWHNLDQYFSILVTSHSNHKQVRVEVEMRVQELSSLAARTYELHHELCDLKRIERDYLTARVIEKSVLSIRIDQLEEKEGLVRSLKEKSLWTRKFDEIVEKLVDIATYIHQAILESFGNSGMNRTLINEEGGKIHDRLGERDRDYANMIEWINKYAYNACITHNWYMPPDVKTIVLPRLQNLENVKEELSVDQIKAEMEKILEWLVPLAENTKIARENWERKVLMQDWSCHKLADDKEPFRLQTLYHADKHKTDEYILELTILRHRFMNKILKLEPSRLDFYLEP